MSEMKFREAVRFSHWDHCGDQSGFEFIRAVGKTFSETINRVTWIIGFIAQIVSMAQEFQVLIEKATFNVQGNLDEMRPELIEKIRQEHTRLAEQYFGSYNPDADTAELCGRWFQGGMIFIDSMEDRGDVKHGILSVYHALLIGAWTAFETMASDLWEQCLNQFPKLAFIAMDAEVDPDDDEAEIERKRRIKFSLPNSFVQEQGLNLENKMGGLLRQRWDFQRLASIEDAYLKVFQDSKQDIERIFENLSLECLSAVRNIIVHKAGIADEKFTWQVKKHTTLKAVAKGEFVPIDGILVKELVSASIDQGRALLDFVDKWLKNHNP
jgi:hypothetical protein